MCPEIAVAGRHGQDGTPGSATTTPLGQIGPQVQDLIPDHPAAREALDLATALLPAPILYHSLRTWIWADHFSRHPLHGDPAASTTASRDDDKPLSPVAPSAPLPSHVLFVACVLHDVGVAPVFDASPARFEICGADEAARVLRRHRTDEAQIRDAWLAMALHSTGGLADRLSGPLGDLRAAIGVEFGRHTAPLRADGLGDPAARALEAGLLPRLDIEKVLGDEVVAQVRRAPGAGAKGDSKRPCNSWPDLLVRAADAEPAWDGVNKNF